MPPKLYPHDVIPDFNFGDNPHPEQPKYSNLSCWSAHPDKPHGLKSANNLVPFDESSEPETLPELDSRPCDCFFVAGTYFAASKERWNARAPDRESKAPFWAHPDLTQDKHADIEIMAEASAFNNRCRV
eukprot:Hpha_TRINITY_DN25889_c0_g1::TRINITY_DN25889_c0_g1_i1::g.19915::m.19915